MTFTRRRFEDEPVHDHGRKMEDAAVMPQVSDTVWELLLDQFLAIPDLANLSLTHIRLLFWLRDQVSVTAQQARSEFGPAPIITARLLTRLVRRGLITRCGDLHDRNIVYLHLSDAGVALLSRMEACQRRSFRRLLSTLTEDELHDFAAGFDLILQSERGYKGHFEL